VSLVVFINPHSRAAQRDPDLPRRLARETGGAAEVLAPATLADLDLAAAAVAAARPRTIAIYGGDGTIHRTVSALLRASGRGVEAGGGASPLPRIAILPGGTMNVVASSLGLRAPPRAALAALVERHRAGDTLPLVSRRCLRVGDVHGFVFGNGFIAGFLDEYYAGGGYGPRRALWVLMRTFLSALVGGATARRVFRVFRGRVLVDGQALPDTAVSAISAGTVREVGMGFKLNHRADEDPDRFSVLAIRAGALALGLDLGRVRRGLGIAPSRAWSGLGAHVRLEPADDDSAYTIDGDLYRARGPFEIVAGPRLDFVRPVPPASPGTR